MLGSILLQALRQAVSRYEKQLRGRIDAYRLDQEHIANEFQIHAVSPSPYSDNLRRYIHAARKTDCSSHILQTSGSTSVPKELFYPECRLAELQREFLLQLLLTYRDSNPAGVERFYCLTSLLQSQSLSRALLRQPDLSPDARCALSKSIVFEPTAVDLSKEVSEIWVHVAYCLLLRPTVLVAANPSSILVFAQRAAELWSEGREVLRRIIPRAWRGLTLKKRHLLKRWSLERALALANIPSVSPLQIFPEVQAVSCWTGGYVDPYITRLIHAFHDRPLVINPLMSLSTETVMGLHYPDLREGQLPLYPRVLYEFFPDSVSDPGNVLISPWNLTPEETYGMIVSDDYGLRRYVTEDLFLCRGHIGDVPIISFVGRQGLQFSFSGEKLTASQLLEAYCKSQRHLDQKDAKAITCFPDGGGPSSLPRYVFVICGDVKQQILDDAPQLLDSAIMEINSEYRAKRESSRLALPHVTALPLDELLRCLKDLHPNPHELDITQLKLLPIYPKVHWQQISKRAR